MLKIEGLNKIYNRKRVVNNIDIQIRRGEIVGLLGSNGAGKTTTFYSALGLISADDGSIYLDNKEISNLPVYKRANLGIGYLPQETSIFRNLSVYDNLKSILELQNIDDDKAKFKIKNLLTEFEIEHLKNRKGKYLSGGEKRRVEIARTLTTNPNFIFLDEPFAGIDPIAVNDIKDIIKKLKRKNIGILITDHNVNDTLSITDYSYIMHKGKMLFSGSAVEVANNEKVKKYYLGKNFKLN
ncbi:MAG: LPS export ABC transporter ATP-binding protein [Bacillota bacterium]